MIYRKRHAETHTSPRAKPLIAGGKWPLRPECGAATFKQDASYEAGKSPPDIPVGAGYNAV